MIISGGYKWSVNQRQTSRNVTAPTSHVQERVFAVNVLLITLQCASYLRAASPELPRQPMTDLSGHLQRIVGSSETEGGGFNLWEGL